MASRRRASSPFNPLGSLVFTLGIVGFAVILYATTRLLTEPMPQRWVGSAPPMATDQVPELPFSERVAGVTRRLEKSELPMPTPVVQAQGSGAVRYEHRQYELTLPPEEAGAVRAALDQARGNDPTVVAGVEDVEGGQRGEIGVDGLLTHTVLVRWKVAPTPLPARAAIVIDDMGNNLLAVRDILALPFPITVAVIPFRPFSREVAESAYQRHHEVLLHLPMEARSGEENGEAEVLRVSDSADQLAQTFDRSLAEVPHVVGVNNHMGSRFTENADRMRVVLERLRQRNLFYLDSLTTPRSSARAIAEALGVPYVARKVFLDDDVDEAAIRRQLDELIAAAKRDGQAVAIGHPHPETLNALDGFADLARQEGVEIVTVGSLVKPSGAGGRGAAAGQ